jgi:acetyl esterase
MTALESGMEAYFAEMQKRIGPAPAAPSLHNRRARMEQIAAAMHTGVPEGVEGQAWFIPLAGREIPIRIYRHSSAARRPLILFFHGGGWVTGSLDSHHYLAAGLAMGAGATVVSVHYRRPPENPYPAPLDDCVEALRWAVAHPDFLGIDHRRVAVAGDSAGAHLATACAMRARDSAGPALAFQALIYPMVEPEFATPSYHRFAQGPGLTRDDAKFYWRALLGEGLAGDAAAIPIRADLTGLPPAYVLVAECDPLRDEGEALAARLSSSRVPVEMRLAPAVPHGFLRAGAFSDTARHELDLVGRKLKAALS